jgi:hypothetical protein
MKKHLLVLFCALALILSGSMAFAGSQVNPYAGIDSHDYDGTNTPWNNDGAWAKGESWGNISNYGYAQKGIFGTFDHAAGEVTATSDSAAGAFDADFGRTSVAGAGAVTNVHVYGGGHAMANGLFDVEDSFTIGSINGESEQGNWANEVGYPSGTSAAGGNYSNANFNATAVDAEYNGTLNPDDFANSNIDLEGTAVAGGITCVTVDPYGSNQSAHGKTANFAATDVRGADRQNLNVYGNGDLRTQANAGHIGAYGSAGTFGNFSYNGGVFGAGVSEGTSYVDADPHSAYATANGRSATFSLGTPDFGNDN